MKHFIDSVKKSLKESNWNGALSLALTLPDICGKIEFQNESSSSRYPKWFDQYISQYYQTEDPTAAYLGLANFITGKDCYALRCAYLHEGSDEITRQPIQQYIDRFEFITRPEYHCNAYITLPANTNQSEIDDMIPIPRDYFKLQLNVAQFCEDINRGVESWLNDIEDDYVKMEKVNTRMLIH